VLKASNAVIFRIELRNKLVVVLASSAASLLLGIDDFRVLVVTVSIVSVVSVVSGRFNEPLVIIIVTASCNAIVLQFPCTFTTNILGQLNEVIDLVPAQIFEDVVKVVSFFKLITQVFYSLPSHQIFGNFGPNFRGKTMGSPDSIVSTPAGLLLRGLSLTSGINGNSLGSRGDIDDCPVGRSA